MAFSKNRRLSDIISDTSGNLTAVGLVVPTQSTSDNDTSAASTAFVHNHIDALVDSAPGTMNTLNEIAAALNDDANFNTTVTNSIAAKLPLSGGTMTGGLSIRGFNGPVLKLGSSSTADPRIDFEDQNSTDLGAGIFLDQDQDTLRILRTVSGSAVDGIAIDPDGHVGIGEDDPDGELHVKGMGGGNGDIFVERTSGAKIHLQAQSANGKIGTSSNHNLGLNTNGTTRLTIDTNGNVGIGTIPTDYYSGGDNLVVGTGSSEGGITMASTGTGQWNYLLFADGTSGDARYRGQVAYNHNDDNLALTSSGFVTVLTSSGRSEMARFDANGLLRIGASGGTGQRLSINGHSTSDSMTEGNAWLVAEASGGDGIAMGSRATTPYATWIQSGYLNTMGTSNHYPILINPHGGNVSVGGGTAPTHALEVNGNIDAHGAGGRVSGYVQDMFHIGAEKNGTGTDRYGHSTTRTYVDGGSTNYQGYVWTSENWIPQVFIPYSPNQVYRLSASLYQLTGSTASGGNSSRHYLGVAGYDENFNFLNVDTIGTYQYILGSNVTVSTGNFLEVDITLKGWNPSGQGNGNKMDEGTVYIRPLILFNYQSGGGTAVLTGFNIMPAGTVSDNDSNAGTNY